MRDLSGGDPAISGCEIIDGAPKSCTYHKVIQHSPTTQLARQRTSARSTCASCAAPPPPALSPRQRRKMCGTCGSRSRHGFGRGAHRAVRPPGQR
eukprot:7206755-Prymnesium_polylepis.1